MRSRIGAILAACCLLGIGSCKMEPADWNEKDESEDILSELTDSPDSVTTDSRAEQIHYENRSDNPYWPQVEELLKGYLTNEVYMDVAWVTTSWSEADREIENPPKYVFEVYLYSNDFPGTHDERGNLINNWVVIRDHCVEEKGRFDFWVWIESDGEKDILRTDFPQQLYSNILANVSSEMVLDGGQGILLGYSPSYSGYAIPYYELMEEPVVMWAMGEDESVEAVFREAYERMHEWQSQIDGDLTQTVRYCDSFAPDDEARYIDPGKPREDLSQQEFTNWISLMEVRGYWYWLDRYGEYFTEHELSFYSEYGEEQENFFETLAAERRAYLGEEEGPENLEDERTYTVQKGDTLWHISVQYYGDGRHYAKIWEENREVIGDDMNYILPGMILRIPD